MAGMTFQGYAQIQCGFVDSPTESTLLFVWSCNKSLRRTRSMKSFLPRASAAVGVQEPEANDHCLNTGGRSADVDENSDLTRRKMDEIGS